ncbi:MAG: ABC transporter ATP-binding protein [Actinomycetota bacterium]
MSSPKQQTPTLASSTGDKLDWRGVASEDQDKITAEAAKLIHRRSRQLLGELVRPYRRRLGWAIVWVIIMIAGGLTAPQLIRKAIDDGIEPFRGSGVFPRQLFWILIAFLSVVTIEALAERWFQRTSGQLTQDALRDLRVRVFKKFQQLSMSFHENYTSGRAIARMTSDIDALSELFGSGINLVVVSILELGGIAFLLFWMDPLLAALLMLLVPGTQILTRWFQKRAGEAYRRQRRTVALLIVHTVETIGGMRAVQAFRREPRNDEIMRDLNADYSGANIQSIRLLSIFAPGLSFAGRVGSAMVLLIGGARVGSGAMTLGAFVAFLLYVRRFFEPLQELSQVYNLFQSAAAALDNLAGVIEEEPTVADPKIPVVPRDVRGAITFEGVRFAYREVEVLHGIDIEVPAGQTVALVGETGAGKTTFARLVARFWDPTEGRVLLDGTDLRGFSDADLRQMIAMVTQESFLFSGTVADNIALGKPSATRSEIVAAAEAIGARGFIEALPEGFDTDVRKRGGRLSAGQRQLVSFARAFIADPKVLILDEATSSLDIPSERAVQHAMRTLLADRTAFIIAHRLTTVEVADRVLVVGDGRIMEDGSPAELIASGGEYAGLHAQWLASLAR